MSEFSELSIHLNQTLSKQDRKKEGIYFTPKSARKLIIDFLDHFLLKHVDYRFNTILEPSFGSGEFIEDVKKYEGQIYGIEKNKTIFDKTVSTFPDCFLENIDFLDYTTSQQFDLIIGNPPFFVTNIKNKECMIGRGNIFVLILYKCLTVHLKKNGILAFVLPTSFYNCKYYEPCRQYIKDNCKILYMKNIQDSDFHDTDQNTMIMIIQNTPSKNRKYMIEFESTLCFTPYYKEIETILKGSFTLQQLGFKVKTGEIVWNEHKKDLDDDDGTIVIYSGNIVNNQLVLNNLKGEKKQFIQNCSKPINTGPAILISRGYGNNYIFSYTTIDENIEFYGENHINIIYTDDPEKIEYIPRIIESFEDQRTIDFVKLYVGNGALSKTEIETVLPIFLQREIIFE